MNDNPGYPDLILRAEGLFSTHGFYDGDLIYDWVDDAEDAGCDVDGMREKFDGFRDHQVLRSLVHEHLLPLIPGDFTVYGLVNTRHNPIRIDTWRGREWDSCNGPPAEIQHICAVVPGRVVADAVRSVWCRQL